MSEDPTPGTWISAGLLIAFTVILLATIYGGAPMP